MKLLLSILLMAPFFASAATEIIYNRSANPYVPERGYVTRDQVCIDEESQTVEASLPGQAPVKASLTANREVCVEWNRTDSAHPVCTKKANKEVLLGDSYTQYLYDASDYRKERPNVRVKRIEACVK
ncbi:hypothetical protein ACLSU7_07775 [Bdellovibrio sp. HCB185ZH]|uniref:hypothetical protein n=1 Tax=Bdellovibrio sp. HCB185ZH TaxID=3394235 RepID=UPI0039A654B3